MRQLWIAGRLYSLFPRGVLQGARTGAIIGSLQLSLDKAFGAHHPAKRVRTPLEVGGPTALATVLS